MRSLISTALVASFVVVVNAESHTVKFINNCGFGTPTLSIDGSVVSSGSDYTSNGQIQGATAWLDYDGCSSGGGNCTGVELTLTDGISAADVTLISPRAFSVASCMSFYNGCDGTGFACTEPNCPGAYLTPTDNSATTIECQTSGVNMVVSFCDCSATSGSSGSGGGTTTSTTTTSTAQATPTSTTPTPTPQSSATSTEAGATPKSSTAQITAPVSSLLSSSTLQTGTATGSSSSTSGSTTGSATSSPSQSSQPGNDASASVPSASASSTAAVGERGSREASNRSSNTGAIAGGVVGGILGLLALIAGTVFCLRRRRARMSHKPEIDDFEVVDPFSGGPTPQTRMIFGEKSGQGATSSTTLLRDGDVMDISHPPPSSEAASSSAHPLPTSPARPDDQTRIIEDVVLRTLRGSNGQAAHTPTPAVGAPPAPARARSPSGDPADLSAIEGVVHRVLQGFLGGQHGDEPPPTYVR